MDIVVTIILIGGLFFFAGGAIGIIRLPEFYCRLHAAGQLDTMGVLWTMAALALYVLDDFSLGAILTSLKIILIVFFISDLSPDRLPKLLKAALSGGAAILADWPRFVHNPPDHRFPA